MFQIGVFIGPVLTVFLSVFGFTSRYSDIPSYFHAFYEISYFRAAFQGSFYSLYGFNRSTLVCPEFYCHFRYPPKFLQEMQFDHVDITFDINYILLCGVLFYLLTVYSIWFKLNKRWGLFILEQYQYFLESLSAPFKDVKVFRWYRDKWNRNHSANCRFCYQYVLKNLCRF